MPETILQPPCLWAEGSLNIGESFQLSPFQLSLQDESVTYSTGRVNLLILRSGVPRQGQASPPHHGFEEKPNHEVVTIENWPVIMKFLCHWVKFLCSFSTPHRCTGSTHRSSRESMRSIRELGGAYASRWRSLTGTDASGGSEPRGPSENGIRPVRSLNEVSVHNACVHCSSCRRFLQVCTSSNRIVEIHSSGHTGHTYLETPH